MSPYVVEAIVISVGMALPRKMISSAQRAPTQRCRTMSSTTVIVVHMMMEPSATSALVMSTVTGWCSMFVMLVEMARLTVSHWVSVRVVLM